MIITTMAYSTRVTNCLLEKASSLTARCSYRTQKASSNILGYPMRVIVSESPSKMDGTLQNDILCSKSGIYRWKYLFKDRERFAGRLSLITTRVSAWK